ncbi:hypothetical protein, partial [Streptococcus suis]
YGFSISNQSFITKKYKNIRLFLLLHHFSEKYLVIFIHNTKNHPSSLTQFSSKYSSQLKNLFQTEENCSYLAAL